VQPIAVHAGRDTATPRPILIFIHGGGWIAGYFRDSEQDMGGTPREHPDRYTATSSATYLSPASPPTLLLLGEEDRLVPIAGAKRFARQARALGRTVNVLECPTQIIGSTTRSARSATSSIARRRSAFSSAKALP
jgi:acetyl esterase/lipase